MKEVSRNDNDIWETNELLTATILKCYGYNEIDMEYDSDANSVYWRFANTPELMSIVVQIALKRCRVEPLEFNQLYVGTKDKMFRLMKTEGVRPRARIRT